MSILSCEISIQGRVTLCRRLADILISKEDKKGIVWSKVLTQLKDEGYSEELGWELLQEMAKRNAIRFDENWNIEVLSLKPLSLWCEVM